MQSELHIRLLGGFQVQRCLQGVAGGEPVTTLNTPRLQSLLAYLLLHREAPQMRQHIAFLFWPDSTENQAQTNLRKLIVHLRRSLPDLDNYIALDRRTIQWCDDSPYMLDVSDFERAIEVSGHPASNAAVAEEIPRLRAAVDLYMGDLLPGCYDEWIAAPRERLRQGFLEALQRLVSALQDSGEVGSAILYAGRLLRYDPLQEANYRRLMQLYIANGDGAAAIAVYRQCASFLKRELGVEPSPATYEIIRHLEEASGRTAGKTPRRGPGAGSGSRVPDTRHTDNNLPAPTTLFIGRERDVSIVSDLLRRDGIRLVTLTGTAGTGKTRLALQTASGLAALRPGAHSPAGHPFPDGIFFVPLASVDDAGLIPSAVARTLGVVEQAPRSGAAESGNRPVTDTLLEYLRDKGLLLVLDNFEHLLPGASLVAELLSKSPRLKVLVTSRATLNLRGEHEYSLQPMSVPSRDVLGAAALIPEDMVQYEAVALFVERALEVSPGFVLSRSNARSIAEICRRLEGLPLAIELAAARVRVLSPDAILSRLDRRLKLLVGGRRDLPPRQQTLEAAIAWSYNLLDPAEQTLFRKLAIFSGGFTLEAAEAVTETVDPLETISALVNKSLLVRNDPSEVTDPATQRQGEVHDSPQERFAMLETLRDYATERLVESQGSRNAAARVPGVSQGGSEASSVQERHALYFMQWAERARPHLVGAEEASLLGMMDLEHDNLRSALSWYITKGDAEGALRLTNALGSFWQYRSYFSEGRKWESQALDLGFALLQKLSANSYQPSDVGRRTSVVSRRDLESLIARALHNAGFLAMRQGDYKEAQALSTRSLEMCRSLGEEARVANILVTLGNTEFHMGEYKSAREHCEEGLLLFRALDEKAGISFAAQSLGLIASNQGRYDEGRQLIEEALAIERARGIKSGMALNLLWLARLALNHLHDTALARSQFEEALGLSRELGNRWMEGWLLLNLGEVARFEERYGDAEEYYEQSRRIMKQLGERAGIAVSSVNLAYLLLDDRRTANDVGGGWRVDGHRSTVELSDSLWVLLTEALSILQKDNDPLPLVQVVAGFGKYWAAHGQYEQAATLFGATYALEEQFGIVMDEVDRVTVERWIAETQSRIDTAAWDKAWAAGKAMSLEQATALAESAG